MKKFFKEFKEFINKGNALALAIGVIIGGAFTAIVTSINKNIISPLIGLVVGNKDLSNSLITILKQHPDPNDPTKMITDNAIYWGAFIQAVIDFLLIALVLFLIFKIGARLSDAAKKATDMIGKKMHKDAAAEEGENK